MARVSKVVSLPTGTVCNLITPLLVFFVSGRLLSYDLTRLTPNLATRRKTLLKRARLRRGPDVQSRATSTSSRPNRYPRQTNEAWFTWDLIKYSVHACSYRRASNG